MQEFMTKEDIRAVFFECEMKDPEGLYADEVDIYELADKLIQVIAYRAARAERAECIKIVNSLNPLIGQALEKNRGKL